MNQGEVYTMLAEEWQRGNISFIKPAKEWVRASDAHPSDGEYRYGFEVHFKDGTSPLFYELIA